MVLAGLPVTAGGLSLRWGGIETKGAASSRNRLKHWQSYMSTHGRNLTTIRNPQFVKLVRIGIPENIRGEVWEVCSGGMIMRYLNPGYYDGLLKAHEGKTSTATEEIEKDLRRYAT